jgi:hypothetical protein
MEERMGVEPVDPLADLPPIPALPEGFSRWVYRGKGWKSEKRVRFASYGRFDTDWVTFPFGCTIGYEDTHYIEAVKDESVALDQRVFPIPSGWNLPPVPKGYNRWVYRGTFKGHTIVAKDRHVLYDFQWEEGDWHKTIYFSGNFHHIEAVKDPA